MDITERTIDLLTKSYTSMCKALILEGIEKDYEDMVDTALELNDEDLISNEEIVETYIKVLKKFL